MTCKEHKYLILDANVLIDYVQSDITILTLVADNIGEIFVPSPVAEEVRGADRQTLENHGLRVIEPELDHIINAETSKGPLSFQDRLCFLIAKDNACSCITNDKPLRRVCETNKVPVLWGLELMIMLVNANKLSKKTASKVADRIHTLNPRYIGKGVLKDFRLKIAAGKVKPRR